MSELPPPQNSPKDRKQLPIGVWFVIVFGTLALCGCGIGALLIPVFSKARHEVDTMRSESDAKLIAQAVSLYLSDTNDRMPPFSTSTEVTEKIKGYFSGDKLFNLSSELEWNNNVSGVTLQKLQDPANTWLFISPIPLAGDRRDVAFMDFHVSALPLQEINRVKNMPFGLDKP